MSRRRLTRYGISLATVAACLGVGLIGCGSSASSLGCSDYRAKDTADRQTAIQQLLSDHHSSSSVTFTQLSVDGYCATHPDGKIDGIYG